MTSAASAGVIVGIDIGGTFTDLVALDEATRTVYSHKELTTAADPTQAVAAGLAKLLQANGLRPQAVTRVVHATTLFTNAIIQRTGAGVALITTAGFRDTLEIGRERKYELYNLFIEMPQPPCPREQRFEVEERTGADGAVLVGISEDQVAEAAARAVRSGCDSLAICFLNSFVNGENESAAAAIVRRLFPDLPLSVSHKVANEIREYDRFSTTIANAYIQPLAQRYLGRFERTLRDAGIAAPAYVMLSNGGLTTIENAIARPIELLESGPAAGALAAAYFAGLAGIADVMALDIGGTTAKLCTIEDGVPTVTHRFEAAREKRFVAESGLPVRIATIDLIEIGAGGGSVARKDQLGLLKVGPQSMGADPGPVCYGRGGVEPTVTDANLSLGYLDPEHFAGGELQLDAATAHRALSRLGETLSLSSVAAACGVHDLANENMAAAARVHAAERGRDPSSLALVVTGGGGPIHGPGVAAKLGIRTVICPPAAGVASAIGLVMAPARIDKVAYVSATLDVAGASSLERSFGDLAARARQDLARMAVPADDALLQRHADMRYIGQGFEILVPLPPGPYGEDALAAIRTAFEDEYRKIFNRIIDDAQIEIVNARLTAVVRLTEPGELMLPSRPGGGRRKRGASRRGVTFVGALGAEQETPVMRWSELEPRRMVQGPALLEQDGSTLVVGPGDRLRRADAGIVQLDLASAEGADRGSARFDSVGLEVLWKRLIGIVDEASAALVRSSFSTVVRESDDYSIVITDHQGRLVAQGTKSIPVFISSLPRTVRHFLEAFGQKGLAEGDVLITNDPWMGTGHLSDINLALPIFHQGKLVAFAASTAHAIDIGGRSGAQKIPDVFEEGFQIPVLKLAERGKLDQTLLALLQRNVRAPEQVRGDLFGQMAALSLVQQRVLGVMQEWGLASLEEFADAAIQRTDAAMRAAVARLPKGVYRAEQQTDGMDTPITLRASVSVTDDGVTVDYAGSSGEIPAALNVAYCYTHAFTVYALKCLLDPESPNNEGSFGCLRVVAAPGSILNHRYPLSGGNRALVGHYLPSLVLEALAQAVPDKVIAGVGSPIWSFLLRGRTNDNRNVVLKCFFNGGMGASATRDGLSATSWPSNISSAPVEVIEQLAPVRVNFKRLRRGSGGSGRQRGGLGLEVEFEVVAEGRYTIGFNAERTRFPAKGLFGGGAGALGELRINGQVVDIRETQSLHRGDRIVVRTPGGGGMGRSDERPSAHAAEDRERGYV